MSDGWHSDDGRHIWPPLWPNFPRGCLTAILLVLICIVARCGLAGAIALLTE